MNYINPASSGINGTSQKTSSEIKKELESLESTVSSLSTTVANNAKIIGSTTHTLPTGNITTMINNAVTTSETYADTKDSALKSSLESSVVTDALQVNGNATVNHTVNTAQLVATGYRNDNTQSKMVDLDVSNELQARVLRTVNGYIQATGSAESTITNLNSTTLKATNVTANTATITDLNATNLNLESFNTEGELTAEEVSATLVKGGTLIGDKLTIDQQNNWNTITGELTNEYLYKVDIPDYNGIITMLTPESKLSISIFNNSYVTFCQSSLYLYRVSFGEGLISLFFESLPSNKYKFLFVGADTTITATPDRVLKTLYKRNISVLKGSVTSSPISEEGGTTEFNVQYVDTISGITGVEKTIFIARDTGLSYVWYANSWVPLTSPEDVESATSGEDAYKPTVDLTTEITDDEGVSTNTGNTNKFVTSRELYNDVRAPFKALLATKGKAKGIASLDASGHIPPAQLPTASFYLVGYLDGSTHPDAPEIKPDYVNGAQIMVTKAGYYVASTAFTVPGGEEKRTLTELEVSEANALIDNGFVFTLKDETTGTTYSSPVNRFATDKVTLEDGTEITLPNEDTLSATSTPSTINVNVQQGDMLTLLDGHWIHMSNSTYVTSVNEQKGAVVTIDDKASADTSTTTSYSSNKSNLTYVKKSDVQTEVNDSENPPTSSAVKTKIESLDVAEKGGTGKFIQAISETDGIIDASAGDIASSVASDNSNPVASNAVYNDCVRNTLKSGSSVTDAVTYGDLNPVTSNAVNDALANYQPKGDYALSSSIPTKTSQLTNNSGYITSSSVPSKTSQLTNDSGFISTSSYPQITDIGTNYRKWSNGLKECWGTTSNRTSVSFPISFNSSPTVVLTVGFSANWDYQLAVSSVSTSGFTMYNYSQGADIRAYWFAIGY